MKIGILTLPLHTNYGGILQAYALKTSLEKLGHEVLLIDTDFKKKSKLRVLKEKIKNVIKKNPVITENIKINKIKYKTFLTYIKPFIIKNIKNITSTFTNPKTIEKEIKIYNFDAYIVGSDQIWNPKYFNHIDIAFFSFIQSGNPLRISYAPSFGGDTWGFSQEKEKICKDLIKKFNAVSVREDSGVELCQKYLDTNATWVLDPTLLLYPEDYLKIVPKSQIKKIQTLFIYILDKTVDKNNIVTAVSNYFNLTPHELDFEEYEQPIPIECCTKATVEDWIRNFYEAEFIVTDSFHGTVFSILFNKPFYSIINIKRGATRFQSLLKSFNLEDRMLSSFEDLNNSNLNREIDWESVNKILEDKRKISNSFLSKALIK